MDILLVALSILILLAILLFIKVKIDEKYAEDSSHSIHTEIRLRTLNKSVSNRLSKYSIEELERIQDSLREVYFKRKLKFPLSEEEKVLLIKFPKSFSVMKMRYASKKK